MTRLKLLFSTTRAILSLIGILACIVFSLPFFVVGFVVGMIRRGSIAGYQAAHDL